MSGFSTAVPRALALGCLLLTAWACATGSGEKAADETSQAKSQSDAPSKKTTKPAEKAKSQPLAIESDPADDDALRLANKLSTPPAGSLGAYVRDLGRKGGVSLVLMNGLEQLKAPPLSTPLDAQVLAPLGATAQSAPDYLFVYPDKDPYKRLADVSLQGKLDPTYRDLKAGLTFGAGTPLFTALAILSQALNKTIIADNAIAESRCGEMAVAEIPLESALEALLKSARVIGFTIDSTDEYVFIAGKENKAPREVLLNSGSLNETQKALLENRITVHLPSPAAAPGQLVVAPGAERLDDVLGALSAQLGVPLAADKRLRDFPINPAVLNNVRVRTALDLLLRQWLVPDFGYEVRPDGILIRPRTPEDRV